MAQGGRIEQGMYRLVIIKAAIVASLELVHCIDRIRHV
jgi:hypothetical protein